MSGNTLFIGDLIAEAVQSARVALYVAGARLILQQTKPVHTLYRVSTRSSLTWWLNSTTRKYVNTGASTCLLLLYCWKYSF